MADHEALLRRFQPQVLYDSNEAFFADSAAEWTDNPGNVLRRREGDVERVLAAASPAEGEEQLSLAFLGHPEYANGERVEREDAIGNPRRDYRDQYVALRQRPGYANRVYGHATEDSDGRLWLQYWFYYFYNDYNLAGGFGLHEGDWEMVQLRMAGERPDLAVYAQHAHAEKAAWEDVEKLRGSPDTAVIYVARGSHAAYFRAGHHETEAWYDLADGRRRSPRLELEIVGDGSPSWVAWPGRWGDTPVRIRDLQQPSPRGPAAHGHWSDPGRLLAEARTHARPAPLSPPEVTVTRTHGHLRLAFDFSGRRDSTPHKLVVTLNSADARLPPRTHTFTVEGSLRGTIDTRLALRDEQGYDISVSTTDAEGRPSEAKLTMLDPVPAKRPLSQSLLVGLGRVVAFLRGQLARRGSR